jgi:hypothetical protein
MLMAACAPQAAGTAVGAGTSPTPALATATQAPPTETPIPVTPTPAGPARPQYTLDATMYYTYKVLTVHETIVYPNRTGTTLSDFVLAVEPNIWPGGFVLQSVTVDGSSPAYTLETQGQRLTIEPTQPVPDGATATIAIDFKLLLPESATYRDPNDVRPQIYGYTNRQVNLVDWYPFVVPYVPGSGWLLHNPWFYGEHLVYDSADFDVALHFSEDSTVPVIASSGEQVSSGEKSFEYQLENARTFAFSMSSQFQVESTQVGDVTVYSYYFPFYKVPGHSVLETTAKALEIYTDEFGPYLHKTLSAVQGDFNDGMEFSALYFLSRDFYNVYDGTPKNYLTIIAAHETAHQWWFDAVADDQAIEPWLDESLATYSEHIFFEKAFPSQVKWWWDFRVNFYTPTGYVDTRIYDAGGYRPYLNAVYLNGAKFQDALRVRIGDDDYFAFMRDIYKNYVGGRITGEEYFALLRQHTSVQTDDLIAQYFTGSY